MARFTDDTMFRYAAANYLRSWVVIDSVFVDKFNTALTCDVLAALLREYKAIRNFKNHKKEGSERFQFFVDVLIGIKSEHAPMNALDPVKIVTQINSEIIPRYKSDKHRNFVSAASKTAWMLLRHPVAIYDSLACGALRSLKHKFADGDYDGYYRAWMQYRSNMDSSIEAASKWVASSDYANRLAAHGAATMQDIEAWARSDWFKNRICDQRLTWLGDGDALPLADLAALVGPNELA